MSMKYASDIDGGYHELALAIMERAVKDLRQANRELREMAANNKKTARYEEFIELKKDCEEFLVSDWFYNIAAGTRGLDTEAIRRMASQRTSICAAAEV